MIVITIVIIIIIVSLYRVLTDKVFIHTHYRIFPHHRQSHHHRHSHHTITTHLTSNDDAATNSIKIATNDLQPKVIPGFEKIIISYPWVWRELEKKIIIKKHHYTAKQKLSLGFGDKKASVHRSSIPMFKDCGKLVFKIVSASPEANTGCFA